MSGRITSFAELSRARRAPAAPPVKPSVFTEMRGRCVHRVYSTSSDGKLSFSNCGAAPFLVGRHGWLCEDHAKLTENRVRREVDLFAVNQTTAEAVIDHDRALRAPTDVKWFRAHTPFWLDKISLAPTPVDGDDADDDLSDE